MSGARELQTEEDYALALAEVEPYFDHEPEVGTPAAARFCMLSRLIDAYEAKHWPIERS